jgi:hypothetical protein
MTAPCPGNFAPQYSGGNESGGLRPCTYLSPSATPTSRQDVAHRHRLPAPSASCRNPTGVQRRSNGPQRRGASSLYFPNDRQHISRRDDQRSPRWPLPPPCAPGRALGPPSFTPRAFARWRASRVREAIIARSFSARAANRCRMKGSTLPRQFVLATTPPTGGHTASDRCSDLHLVIRARSGWVAHVFHRAHTCLRRHAPSVMRPQRKHRRLHSPVGRRTSKKPAPATRHPRIRRV